MTAVERLGYESGTTLAVVHADDIGMSHAANVGAFEALAHGPATCGSVMVPCPWFTEAAELAQDGRDVDLGVHLTLNAEYEGYRWGPVAGRSAVPSLCDDAGHLYPTVRETIEYGTEDDVETELRAQIDAALAAGVDVTHLDSHMGTVFHPKFFAIYLQLARDHRLPLFLPRAAMALLASDDVPDPAAVGAAEPEPGSTTIEAEGFVLFDHYDADSLDFEPGTGAEHNRARIAGLRPGLNYLICHPAQAGEELSAITPTEHQRDFERRYYGGDAGRADLDGAGVLTIGMRPLRDLLQSG